MCKSDIRLRTVIFVGVERRVRGASEWNNCIAPNSGGAAAPNRYS